MSNEPKQTEVHCSNGSDERRSENSEATRLTGRKDVRNLRTYANLAFFGGAGEPANPPLLIVTNINYYPIDKRPNLLD